MVNFGNDLAKRSKGVTWLSIYSLYYLYSLKKMLYLIMFLFVADTVQKLCGEKQVLPVNADIIVLLKRCTI